MPYQKPDQLIAATNAAGEYTVSGILPGQRKVQVDAGAFAWSAELVNPVLEMNAMAIAGQELILDLQFKKE